MNNEISNQEKKIKELREKHSRTQAERIKAIYLAEELEEKKDKLLEELNEEFSILEKMKKNDFDLVKNRAEQGDTGAQFCLEDM